MPITHLGDTGGGENLGAVHAGKMGDVTDRALEGDTTLGGVGHGILLRMDGGLLVTVANLGVVRRARQETIVARGNESIGVLPRGHDHAADVQAFATGARADQNSGGHEIFIPRGAGARVDEGLELAGE